MRRSRRRSKLLSALAGAALLGCRPAPSPAPPGPPPPRESAPVAAVEARATSAYAAVEFAPLTFSAAIPDYRLSADLNEVRNLAEAGLSAAEKQHLAADGFLVRPVSAAHLDTVYRDALTAGQPCYFTADTALFAFFSVRADVLRRLEAQSFPSLLSAMTLTLLSRSQEQLQAAAAPESKEAIRRNIAWFGVAASLLGLSTQLEDGAARLVRAERDRIIAAEGPADSAILPYQLDYAAFRAEPSAADERLERYRLARLWYLHAPLAAKYRGADGEVIDDWRMVRQLALLAQAFAAPAETPLRQWEALDQSRRFLLGGAGLGIGDLLAAADEVWGEARTVREVDRFDRLEAFVAALEARARPEFLPPGAVLGQPLGPMVHLLTEPGDPTAALLAELGAPVNRSTVSGLEVFAALGLPRAEAILETWRVGRANPRYHETMQRLREALAALPPTIWQADLLWASTWSAAPLNDPLGAGYPQFMRRPGWGDRALLTTLAAWAAARAPGELSPVGGAAVRMMPPPPEPVPVMYVEPVPEVYHRLRWLTANLRAGLAAHELATPQTDDACSVLESLLARLESTAVRELANETPTPEERRALAELPHLLRWLLAGLEEGRAGTMTRPARIDGLRVGPGPVQEMLVIVPDAGRFHLARGAMASYLELPADRASAADWPTIAGEAGQPRWARSCVVTNRAAPHLPAATQTPLFVDQAPSRQ